MQDFCLMICVVNTSNVWSHSIFGLNASPLRHKLPYNMLSMLHVVCVGSLGNGIIMYLLATPHVHHNVLQLWPRPQQRPYQVWLMVSMAAPPRLQPGHPQPNLHSQPPQVLRAGMVCATMPRTLTHSTGAQAGPRVTVPLTAPSLQTTYSLRVAKEVSMPENYPGSDYLTASIPISPHYLYM